MSKIPVYFMPGLAASPAIFERIQLPPETFEMHFLEWEIPKKRKFGQLRRKLAQQVPQHGAVLIGVSFGGVMVQEMARFLHLRKLIIISSVKSNKVAATHESDQTDQSLQVDSGEPDPSY
jgi:pimeloyl-ACP methyl ester carboxylesterase